MLKLDQERTLVLDPCWLLLDPFTQNFLIEEGVMMTN